MSDSCIQRKLMLFHHLLKSFYDKDLSTNGFRICKSTGSKPEWGIQDARGEEEYFIRISDLDEYVVGRSLQSRSSSPNDTGPLARLDRMAGFIFPALGGVTNPVSNPNVSVFEFGKKLGLNRAECRYIIDRLYASHFPMLRAMFAGNKEAETFCETYSGCYTLYRYDMNPAVHPSQYPDGILLKSTISIRYPVPHKEYTSNRKGKSTVRVKLNLCSYKNPKISTYEYDGMLGLADGNWWTWILQGRFGGMHSERDDVMLMYTQCLSQVEDNIATGKMLTQNQDISCTPTASNVVLVRECGYTFAETEGLHGERYYKLEPDELDFMKNGPAFINLRNHSTLSTQDLNALKRLLAMNGKTS